MLKNILNLDGAQQLSKNEQKESNGGIRYVPDPICVCATVNYGVYIPGHGVVPMTDENQNQGTVIPIGWTFVQPTPACCQ